VGHRRDGTSDQADHDTPKDHAPNDDAPGGPCADAIRTHGQRVLVTVRVTPRASREAIVCEGGALRVHLTAPPVEGAANEALIALFAQRLRLPKRRITLERGAASREKVLAIADLTPDEFWRRLGL
jgi:uncharacterized protein (TIGR00251 family)